MQRVVTGWDRYGSAAPSCTILLIDVSLRTCIIYHIHQRTFLDAP
jgi:hypothetical protein